MPQTNKSSGNSVTYASPKERSGSDLSSAKKSGSRLRGAKYIAINVFIVFHILAVACWCIPLDTPLIPLCKQLVRPYFLWAGLFQSWDMFAPVPKGVNTYLEAVIVYKDG